MSAKTPELTGMTGPGVEPFSVSLPSIDKAIAKYEQHKEARCKMSPKEVAAKGELLDLLHKNREKLPLNGDGNHYYRLEGVDYVLEEKLKRTKVAGAGEGGED